MVTVTNWPIYRREVDGNVFEWIIQASAVQRSLRQEERKRAIKEAAAKSESLDKPKVEN